MGRVFDAIRKSSAPGDNGKAPKQQSRDTERREEAPRVSRPLPSAREVEEQLFAGSTIMTLARETAPGSASSAHTADVPDGSALPGGIASRDAGATLDAAGATRAGGYVSFDISPARVEPHLVAVSQPRSAYCEQFRALRTRILQAGERLQTRALVVTSTGIAEGKTLTALNLGWLLAQTEGVRALVIDSDLRRPCATDYFGIEANEGLSEVLGGQLRLEDAIVRLDPAGLHLLPGGKPRDDVAELLSGPSYARVLQEARRMFDYIVIDAPPLGIFTDANVLMSRADGALLVVRAGKTRYSAVDKLLEQIPREKLLGVVLNRAEDQPDSTSYYHQYRYSNREPHLNGSKQKPALPEQQREEEVAVLN
ncbi:MAG TPA: CpsD/CapB family tyrosine-protein kinase [Pyrinomonadaceae bacterium]|nr:CpsD/CapB family tyrosine-protein kinase [Pyrinomonadaceae bacterium]